MLEINAQTIAFFIFSVLSLAGGIGVVTSRNLIHGSDSVDNAKIEIANFFTDAELVSWTTPTADFVYQAE